MTAPVLRLAAALAAATLLSACSGSQEPEARPTPTASDDTAAATQVGLVTVVVPDGWQPVTPLPAGQDASFSPPSAQGEPAQGLIVVLDEAAGDAPTAAQLHAATTQAAFPGIEPGTRREVEVPGSDGAVRLDWFLPPGPDRPGGSLYDLVVVRDGQEAVVRLATARPTRDPALADRLLGAVRVAP